MLDRFVTEFKKTSDRQERQRITRAIMNFRDPEAVKAAMQTVLSGEIPLIEGGGYLLVYAGQGSAATRKMPFEFVKEHFDEIAAKRPTGGGFDFGALLPRVGQSYCDAESRDELKSFFEPRVTQFVGAPRTLSQVLEGINVCIAEKAAQEPSVVAFLKKY
jgi:alanyl aminopeptidase